MSLTVLGSGGGSATRINPGSGYLVTAGDDSIWLDAGPGTFMALGAVMDPGELSALVISHIHVDHCSDLFALFGYLAARNRVPVPVTAAEPLVNVTTPVSALPPALTGVASVQVDLS